jgi:hypothetical protein
MIVSTLGREKEHFNARERESFNTEGFPTLRKRERNG